jgi:hypothetical protein
MHLHTAKYPKLPLPLTFSDKNLVYSSYAPKAYHLFLTYISPLVRFCFKVLKAVDTYMPFPRNVIRLCSKRFISWHILTYGAEPFLRSCQLCSHSGTSQHFKEPEGSSSCSQDTSTGPYPEPDRSSPHHPILSLKDYILAYTLMYQGSTCCLLHAGFLLFYFSTLKVEAIYSSETSVDSHRTTRHNIPASVLRISNRINSVSLPCSRYTEPLISNVVLS